MSKSVTRIYQGRVVACRNSQGEPVTDWENDLLEHHRIFQDAVNYYLFALIAMSSETDPVFGKIRKQLKAVWDNFDRNGEERQGLKYTMARILGSDAIRNSPDGFALAEKLVLDDCHVAPEILQAALTHIAEKCKGNVVQQSKSYFPRLCIASFSGNYDLDLKALSLARGRQRLFDALNSDIPVESIKKLIPEMDLGWADIKTQTGQFFTGEEAQKKLREAVSFFIDNPTEFVSKEKLAEYLEKLKSLGNISFGKNNKADPKRKNAMWLLRFFPDECTVALMRNILGTSKKDAKIAIPKFGDDPVKLSRGDRGYVFKPFTELPLWRENVSWHEFDTEAFKEALTIINQFNLKTQERNEELQKYKCAVEWMEGRSEATKAPNAPDTEQDGDDDEIPAAPLPVLCTDPRWIKLDTLLRNRLAIQNCWTEDDVAEYGLSGRTIRSFDGLRQEWQKILSVGRKKAESEEKISAALKKVLADFQTRNRDVIGSAPLFQALAEPEYIDIWDEEFQAGQKNESKDILSDSVRFYFYRERIARLEEPIQLTPADWRHSRRCSDLKALSLRKEYGHRENFSYLMRAAVRRDGSILPEDICIQYSAPRLKRDGLCGKKGESVYAPPVLQSVMPQEEYKPDFKKSAVMLMPDWDREGSLRILLNFPVEIEFQGQFANVRQFSPEQF